jgi:hypothetical protein
MIYADYFIKVNQSALLHYLKFGDNPKKGATHAGTIHPLYRRRKRRGLAHQRLAIPPGYRELNRPCPLTPPLDDPELSDLRWYLETFSTWPTGPDYERAERIEAGLEDWGRALLAGLIAEPEAARLWQQFVDADAEGKLLTIDATAR